MTLSWAPIDPASSPLAGRTRTVASAEAGNNYGGLSVSCYHVDLATTEQLKFQFGGTEGKQDAQYFILEMVCYTSDVFNAELVGDSIYFVRKGVGFRLGVACWDVSMKAATTLAAVSANASFSMAKTEIGLKMYGLDAFKNLTALKSVQIDQGLTPQNLREVARAGEQLADALTSAKELDPRDLAVARIVVGDLNNWSESAASMQLANESVYRGKTYIRAQNDFTEKEKQPEKRALINSIVPRGAYACFGIFSIDETPDEHERESAGEILRAGRF